MNPLFRSLIGSAPSGTTYYVDNTGGNDANGGLSEASAIKTLDKVEDLPLISGDTVLFKRGETWTVKGTTGANSMLTLSAGGFTLDVYGAGAKPVISGGGTVRTGITIQGVGTTTKNLKLYNCGGGTGALWSNAGSSGINYIEDCELDLHASDACATSGVGCATVMRRCELSNFFDDGFTCHGLNGTGSSVEMYNCTIRNGFDGLNHSVTSGGAITTLCEDCVFHTQSSRDIGALDIGTHTFNRCIFKSGSFGSNQSANSDWFFNYCVFDGHLHGTNASGSLAFSAGGTGTFRNCTFKGNPGVSGGTGTINVFSPSSVSFVACIFSNWWRRCFRNAGTETATADYCIAHLVNTGTLSANTNQVSTSDPLFVDPANGDFHLQAGSPALNAYPGPVTWGPDFDGVAVGTPAEVGAFEKV